MVGDLEEMRREDKSQAVLRKISRPRWCEPLEFELGDACGASPAGEGPCIPRRSKLDGMPCSGSVVFYVLLLISIKFH